MRKYKKGALITDLDELLKQEFIWYRGKVYHKGWFRSWSLQFILGQIQYKDFFKAEKKSYREMLGLPPSPCEGCQYDSPTGEGFNACSSHEGCILADDKNIDLL